MDSKKQCTIVKKQSAKRKNVNNQMIRVDSTTVQELKQLVCDLVNCPIHVTNILKRLTAKKTGKTYFKCTVKNCPVFCFEDKLSDYCNVLATKLSPAYKWYTKTRVYHYLSRLACSHVNLFIDLVCHCNACVLSVRHALILIFLTAYHLVARLSLYFPRFQ